jgi:GT2 family glycosyltransferase
VSFGHVGSNPARGVLKMEKKKPKVLVGCPTSNHKAYCLKEYVEALKSLDYANFDILLVDNSEKEDYFSELKKLKIPVERVKYEKQVRDRIVKARNLIVETMIKGNYDYFFSLEQDIIPPVDVIQRLLDCKKNIVSGVYFKEFEYNVENTNIKKEIILPMAFVDYDIKKGLIKQLTYSEVIDDRLIKISTCGLGCILIHKSIFLKDIRFRYEEGKKPFDDVWFCRDVKDAGFEIYLDTSIKCRHLTKGMNWDKINKKIK